MTWLAHRTARFERAIEGAPRGFRPRLSLLAICLVALTACGDDDGTEDAGEDSDLPDVRVDAEPGIPCESDEDCDDDIPCTRDACGDDMFCRRILDHEVCNNGIFCDGAERCVLEEGCMPGPPNACDDGDVCTFDRCNESEKTCERSPRDFDGDGEVDFHCEDGTDCNDRDSTRGATLPEICGDEIDNDCDEDVDEMDCGRGPHDLCDDPLDVSAGGNFTVSLSGASPDYDLSCAAGFREVVLNLSLDEPKDVRVSADSFDFLTAIALRTGCDDEGEERECAADFPAEVRTRALPAGDYTVLLGGTGPGEVDVEIALDAATEAPTNETCANAIAIPPEGDHVDGSFVDVANDYDLSCGFGDPSDLVYTFTLETAKDVVVGLSSPGGEQVAYAIRSTCIDDTSTIRCAAGSMLSGRIHSLDAGTYFLIIEGSDYREVDYTLDVQFLDPTPAPEGDSCRNPVALTAGTSMTAGLADKEDDLDTSCGFSYRDMVFSFTLEERRDVTVTIDGPGFMNASIRPTCTDGATQLRCVSGDPVRSKLRDLGVGTYFVVVESFEGSSFDILVETATPTPVTMVSGNDTCSTATAVPVAGGVFSGSTMATCNSYESTICGGRAEGRDAIFQLTLDAPRRVIATTEGSSYDTVLYTYQSSCPALATSYLCPPPEVSCAATGTCDGGLRCVAGFCVPPGSAGSELYCDDDSGDGSTSVLDQTFPAGTHFFVVDGFGSTGIGDYVFEVTFP